MKTGGSSMQTLHSLPAGCLHTIRHQPAIGTAVCISSCLVSLPFQVTGLLPGVSAPLDMGSHPSSTQHKQQQQKYKSSQHSGAHRGQRSCCRCCNQGRAQIGWGEMLCVWACLACLASIRAAAAGVQYELLDNTISGGLMGIGAQDSPSKALRCTADEAEWQATYFRSRKRLESACPAHIWLPRYQGMSPAGHKLFLDIGCNQGFSSAELFDAFAPELGINKRTLMQAHTPPGAKANMSKCGACLSECTQLHQTPELSHGHRVVEVHCVEPGDLHFTDLIAARTKLFGDTQPGVVTKGSSSGVWHLHNKAVSNETGVASFTSSCTNTRCHLGYGDEQSSYTVQVTTVDELLSQIGSPSHVTFMKIDTEGFDASVLAGAQRALEKKVIQMLLFEYHDMNRWQETQLRDVTSWLDSLGYACYFEGLHHIFKITGGCWHDLYEFHKWSNVVCGLAGGQIELLLDAHSYLRTMRAEADTPAVEAPTDGEEDEQHRRLLHVMTAALVADEMRGGDL